MNNEEIRHCTYWCRTVVKAKGNRREWLAALLLLFDFAPDLGTSAQHGHSSRQIRLGRRAVYMIPCSE